MTQKADNRQVDFCKIEELDFAIIPGHFGDVLKKGKVGFLSKGIMKKLLKSIEEGNASYVKVKIGQEFSIKRLASDDSGFDIYCYRRINTQDDVVVDMGVQLIDKFKPYDHSEGYLLRFKINKDIRYIVVESIEEEYLLNNTKGLSSIDTNQSNNYIIPELREESLLDKIFKKGG